MSSKKPSKEQFKRYCWCCGAEVKDFRKYKNSLCPLCFERMYLSNKFGN